MWNFIFDNVIGTSHLASGIPCQDACRVLELNIAHQCLLVACLSDGAGSAAYADIGANEACDAFVRIVHRDQPAIDNIAGADYESCASMVRDWCEEVRRSVEERAIELGVDLRDLACTFLAALVGETRALFFQIGDGAIVFRRGDELVPAIWPQSGEFANTTNFLTAQDFLGRMEWRFIESRIDELASFTDGLERLILRFSDQSVHRPFLEPLFLALHNAESPGELIEPLRGFLASQKINDRTDDDKTLVLALRVGGLRSDDAIR